MDINLDGSEPPFEETYKNLFHFLNQKPTPLDNTHHPVQITAVESKDLPLVDLGRLVSNSEEEREKCKREIVHASKEWGFFQVVNHGISRKILDEMTKEQKKVFSEPFKKKIKDNCMNMRLSSGTYRWGTPSAKCLTQLSWSEAFHIPLNDISSCESHHVDKNNLSSTVSQFATTVSELAHKLANILAENLGHEGSTFLKDICLPSTCYLRMNRYPPCPKYYHVFGLMPHTDSDFLTILYQDQVGGLQLVKDAKWIQVLPNPDALIVNIGDLLQAWSNGVYRSVEHRVVANKTVERLSIAYFLCPSYDAIIQSCKEPPLYKKFSFREYRQQVHEDVSTLGYKIGLPRFLICG
uniref:gibberellin 2beta-dioxygenase n=1 Tax=Pseudostellaria heterophylla TaxID=418402 RepID=A0A218KIP6_9CARY|nr:gibberellin 2-oxidase 8 [Pseudostellaria heterophylla]